MRGHLHLLPICVTQIHITGLLLGQAFAMVLQAAGTQCVLQVAVHGAQSLLGLHDSYPPVRPSVTHTRMPQKHAPQPPSRSQR